MPRIPAVDRAENPSSNHSTDRPFQSPASSGQMARHWQRAQILIIELIWIWNCYPDSHLADNLDRLGMRANELKKAGNLHFSGHS